MCPREPLWVPPSVNAENLNQCKSTLQSLLKHVKCLTYRAYRVVKHRPPSLSCLPYPARRPFQPTLVEVACRWPVQVIACQHVAFISNHSSFWSQSKYESVFVYATFLQLTQPALDLSSFCSDMFWPPVPTPFLHASLCIQTHHQISLKLMFLTTQYHQISLKLMFLTTQYHQM